MPLSETVRRSQEELLCREILVGGWSFGVSAQIAFEASCLAALALRENRPTAWSRAIDLLLQSRTPDGGWPALFGHGEACWVTSLAVTVLFGADGTSTAIDEAVRWLLNSRGRETQWLWRWKFKTADRRVRFDPDKFGWPWCEGANSWVIPTAFALIALKQVRACGCSRRVDERIRTGVAMLYDRACPGGGWNAGNGVVYGVLLLPHIEPTALALLALRDEPSNGVTRASLDWLKRQASTCRSLSSLAWAAICLFTYGEPFESVLGRIAERVSDPGSITNTATLATAAIALQLGTTVNPFQVPSR